MKSTHKLRVLVVLSASNKPEQDHISGILRYEAAHSDWDLFLHSGHAANSPLADISDWEPDGIIVNEYSLELGLRIQPCRHTKALVSILSPRQTSPFKGMRFASVNVDNRAIGETAAQFLIRKGFRNFGFIGAPFPRLWSDTRQASFVKTLSERGFSCDAYREAGQDTHAPTWGQEQKHLADWLSSLPKPCGIMAAYDQRAKHVLDVCRLNGISVPGSVGVISVDNEEFLCERTHPTLTSIVPDFESCGYRAAELLDSLMHGGRSRTAPQLFGVRGVVERFSTADFSGSVRIVELAREFLRKNYAADITFDDIAKSAGVSIRVLEQRFRHAAGRSPSDELRALRLEHVKELLTRTQTRISDIGELCGFKSDIYLKNVFKNETGMSMRDYRAAKRPDR